MGVCYFDNFDGCDCFPVQPSILPLGNRIVGRNKNQAIRVIQVNTELTFPVGGEFVASRRWNPRDLREMICGIQLHQALLQLSGTGRTMGFEHLLF